MAAPVHVQLCEHVDMLCEEGRRMLLRELLEERNRPTHTGVIAAHAGPFIRRCQCPLQDVLSKFELTLLCFTCGPRDCASGICQDCWKHVSQYPDSTGGQHHMQAAGMQLTGKTRASKGHEDYHQGLSGSGRSMEHQPGST